MYMYIYIYIFIYYPLQNRPTQMNGWILYLLPYLPMHELIYSKMAGLEYSDMFNLTLIMNVELML